MNLQTKNKSMAHTERKWILIFNMDICPNCTIILDANLKSVVFSLFYSFFMKTEFCILTYRTISNKNVLKSCILVFTRYNCFNKNYSHKNWVAWEKTIILFLSILSRYLHSRFLHRIFYVEFLWSLMKDIA